MKILLLDIETSPTLAYVWKLFKETIGINQIVKSGHTISFAAKWYGSSEVIFDSVHKSGLKGMLKHIHQLLDEADVVVHFNGKSFDVPTLNTDFIKEGFNPPSPFKQVDLFRVWKNNFRTPSSRLQYIVKELGLGEKVKTDFDLWRACENGDSKAWAVMEKYNKKDTKLLEDLYVKLLPWISNHPNHGLFNRDAVCPNCGSNSYQNRGVFHTTVMTYRRHKCNSCKKWFRSAKAISKDRPEFRSI